jgi:hypothetical protein
MAVYGLCKAVAGAQQANRSVSLLQGRVVTVLGHLLEMFARERVVMIS